MVQFRTFAIIGSIALTFSTIAWASPSIDIGSEPEFEASGQSRWYKVSYKSDETHGRWKYFGGIHMDGGGISTGYGSDTSDVQIWTVMKDGQASGTCTVKRSQQQNYCCVHKGGIMSDGQCPKP